MLTVQNVSKKYGKTLANDNISFQVRDGQIAILLGPNGAGKSTDAKARLGYIPEMPAVYDMLTVGEHLEFMRRAYKMQEDETYGDALLDRFELLDKKNKLGKELSKGMQQKLSICCALVHRPTTLIFDEPMVGLDPHAIKELKQVFRELKAQGCALLISTHMLDSVEDYWDVAHIMRNGKFAATKVNGDLADEKSLETLFFEITEGAAAEQEA